MRCAPLVLLGACRWEPNEKAWATYINFEERGNQLELARKMYVVPLVSGRSVTF